MKTSKTTTNNRVVFRSQPGPQMVMASSPVDVGIFGGAAGGGKTFYLLMEGCRHVDNPRYEGVIFRRTTPQLTYPGGLWSESFDVCGGIGGKPNMQDHVWEFPAGSSLKFAHMEHEKNRYDWKGSQVPFIGFDQMEDFTKEQILYMLSRNRSTCGVKPYIRGTVNPDPDSFVAEMVEWYIDQETGYAREDRSGVIRWFVNLSDEIHWGNTRQELIDRFVGDEGYAPEDIDPLSFTFVKSKLSDNAILTTKDPAYRRKLLAMSSVERARLLDGNWKTRDVGVIKKEWFKLVSEIDLPSDMELCRWTDMAATHEGGDYTSSILLGRSNGIYFILHNMRGKWSPDARDKKLLEQAEVDYERWGGRVTQCTSEDPGAAGVAQSVAFKKMMSKYPVFVKKETGDKLVRSSPWRSQAEGGNFRMLKGSWNGPLMVAFTNYRGKATDIDDDIDALSGAYNKFNAGSKIRWWESKASKAMLANVRMAETLEELENEAATA